MTSVGDPGYQAGIIADLRATLDQQRRVIEALELTISFLLQEAKRDIK